MSKIFPVYLRCEYLVNPLAIDTPHPRLSWELAGIPPNARGLRQSAYQVIVSDSVGALVWDSGKVESDESLHIQYQGAPLVEGKAYTWKVRVWDQDGEVSDWSEPATFSMGIRGMGWTTAPAWDAPPPKVVSHWITTPLPEKWSETQSLPAAMLRKPFSLRGNVRRAILYASALGVYELRLNGKRVGENILAPEWTDYHQKVQYQAYDVTNQVTNGENVLAAMVGAGWYAGRIGMAQEYAGVWRGVYGRRLALIARLSIEMDTGETITIVTDKSWRVTDQGPIRSADIYDGEVYDARLEMPGWDAPGFDDHTWQVPDTIKGPRLVAQPNEPIRITRTLTPIAVTQPAAGVYIFDMAQNMVGWVRLNLRGERGKEIRLRYGEALNPDGTLYRENLRGAPQTDIYICRGGGDEVFEPHFTYHGFRFVEVTGLEVQPAASDLVGCVFHSAAPEVGKFECSEPLLNKIMSAIQWTQRSNLHGVPTDCPQRDERLGWMGDAQVFSQTAMFNMDMAAFFTKWMADVREAQAKDGRFPDIAPHPFNPDQCFSGNPGWGDAGIIIPWLMYLNYGDKEILKAQFEAAKRYIDWIVRNNPDLIWRNRDQLTPLWYGDWLNADTFADLAGLPRKGGEVPKEVYSTAFLAKSAQLVGRMAEVLNKRGDAVKYCHLAEKVRAAFNHAFVSSDGRIQGDTQAGYALALSFNLLPMELRQLAIEHMLEAFKPYDGALSTGFLSTIRMMIELTRAGYAEKAYELALRREIPSWGYMVEHGGTTIWERWDGWVEGRGFQDPGMNSFNHYAIGSVGEWFYRTIGGINPDESNPGWKHFIIHPIPGGNLTWAEVSHRSIRGLIRCRWEKKEKVFILKIEVPANTGATVYLPAEEGTTITESGVPVERAPGVEALCWRAGCAIFRVGSGHYEFKIDFDS